jgi:hypothetical protein
MVGDCGLGANDEGAPPEQPANKAIDAAALSARNKALFLIGCSSKRIE